MFKVKQPPHISGQKATFEAQPSQGNYFSFICNFLLKPFSHLTRTSSYTMLIQWKIALPIIGMFSVSRAAECYAQDHGHRCPSKDFLLNYRFGWCGTYWNAPLAGWMTVDDNAGNSASISKVGNFVSESECEAAFGNIISECHGLRNGGSWTLHGTNLNINYCAEW
jgi:hypothetical protein